MHCNAVWYHAAKQIAQYCQLLTVTQETEAAFGTEMPRTPSSIASHKAMQSVESVGVCFYHFTSCVQQEPHETPAPSNVAKWQLLQSTLKKPIYLILIKPTGKKKSY